MNKKTVTEIFDIIMKDSQKKPEFLNMHKADHKQVRQALTSCIVELSTLIKPFIIKNNGINDIYNTFDGEWEWVETSITDIVIYFKCEEYIGDLIDKWLDISIDMEEYEVAENINNFKIILESKRKVKNV